MTGIPRPLVLLVTLLLSSAAWAGCTQRDEGDGDGSGSTDGADTILLFLRGVDAPEEADQVVVNMTVGNVAFYDTENSEWVALLTEDAQATVLFAQGDTEAVFLAEVPLVARSYEAVEIVVDRARVTTDDGSSDAEIPPVACYAALTLGAGGDDASIEVELWISGAEALQRENETWTFRPVLVGTDSSASDGELEINEPDCMPYEG